MEILLLLCPPKKENIQIPPYLPAGRAIFLYLLNDQTIEQGYRLQGTGYRVEKIMESPILGGAGNKEYLLHLTFQQE